MAYRPSSSSPPSSTIQNSYGYYASNENIDLPPFFPFPSDLQQVMNDRQHTKEINVHETGLIGKVNRYSPEEKKERIERYRSKRNQRNFQKKITYECRKTLADSRPRVKGRFARNDEGESEMENAESSYGTFNNHIYDSIGTENAEFMADAETENDYDEELWASLVDDFSMNI